MIGRASVPRASATPRHDGAGQNTCQHDYAEEYCGHQCTHCGHLIPYGSEPWMPFDPDECPEAYCFEPEEE